MPTTKHHIGKTKNHIGFFYKALLWVFVIALCCGIAYAENNSAYFTKLHGTSQSLARAIVLGTDNDVDQATTYVWDETEVPYFGFQRYTVDGLKVNKENTVPVSSYGGYYKDIRLKAEFTDPFQLVQVQVNSPSGPYDNAIPGVKQLPVPAFYLCWQIKQQNWEDQMAAFRFLMNVFALTTGTSEIAAAKGVMKIWRVSQIVVPITTEILNYPSIQDKIAQYDGGEEFLALLNRADMLVGVISVGEVAAILPGYAKNLVNAWKRVKNSANKTTGAKIADDLADQYKKVDNLVGGLDETVEVIEEIVIIEGREFISKKFGANSTEVLISVGEKDLLYYLKNDLTEPFADFVLETNTFVPAIEIPKGLRGQGIGKGVFMDAFERLGGYNVIDEIESTWLGNTNLSDNFDTFKKNLLAKDTPSEAAFKTATGKWVKELGYKNVIIPENQAEAVLNGIRFNINLIFTK